MIERFPRTLKPWFLRLLLAALLLGGSEILLWLNPLGRGWGEWLLLAPGYLALAALLLDLAARYRIRDIYDAMTLAAVYGLLNGLLLNPQTALEIIPDTMVNRALGGHTLLGLEMFGLFLALTDGQNRRYRLRLLAGSLWVGFYWGVWVRWLPAFTPFAAAGIPLAAALALSGLWLAAILALFVLAARRSAGLAPSDLRLSVIEWGAVLATLVVLFLVRVGQGAVTSSGLWLAGGLTLLCLAVLWFRRAARGKMLLDRHVPVTPLAWRWIGLSAGVFFSTAVTAYSLPLVRLWGLNQFFLMTLGFASVGLGWLPFIAMVLGVRALDRQSRTGRL